MTLSTLSSYPSQSKTHLACVVNGSPLEYKVGTLEPGTHQPPWWLNGYMVKEEVVWLQSSSFWLRGPGFHCLHLPSWCLYHCHSPQPRVPCCRQTHLCCLLSQFFSCLVMIAYGVSAFFSFQAWRGVGSNAATSQMAGGYA